jgi:hypothetical protein
VSASPSDPYGTGHKKSAMAKKLSGFSAMVYSVAFDAFFMSKIA